jgi:hypothetical protein
MKAEIAASIKPPGNISKAETIELWNIEKKPAAVEEAWRKTSFDGAYGHICVIGMAFDDEPPISLWYPDWHGREADLLKEFFNMIDVRLAEHPNVRPTFIGHYVTEFDLRFLFQRAVMLGVKPSYHIPFDARPWDDGVYDTMTRWAGLKGTVKLDKLAKAMGVGSKGDLDGSKVWDYVDAGRIAEVAEYCKNDVAMTRAIYKRMTFAPTEITAPYDGSDGIPF